MTTSLLALDLLYDPLKIIADSGVHSDAITFIANAMRDYADCGPFVLALNHEGSSTVSSA